MLTNLRLLAMFSIMLFAGTHAAYGACTAQDFAAVVDQSGASLRSLNGAFQPKLKDRMRRYKESAGLPNEGYEDAALEAIQDARLGELDAQSGELILKIDTLGRVADDTAPDCAKLGDIKSASSELDAVIRTKSEYMLSRFDTKIKEAEAKKAAVKPAPAPVVEKRPAKTPDVTPGAGPAAKTDPKTWSSKTTANASKSAPSAAPAAAPVSEPPPPAGITPADEDGYTIEEIRDATKGFFGTISTNLAAVLEHAFKTTGRPTGYVLGNEGGGAFLAGLRYGSGTLYMRNQNDQRQVYWHGPSVGSDIGAEGGRTLFLIYRLPEPSKLYRSFSGIDGSAYFVGGVGMTILKGGEIIMAPIRSGLGLRLGANIGYVRFTDKPTWNPF